MAIGFPDFTKPITIRGITIASLPINIVAQTIATLKIDIVAQTLPQLNINIAAVAETVIMNVNITGSVTLNVYAAQVGTWTVNAVEVGTWTVNANITGSVTLNVNIQSQTVDMNIKTSGGANIIIDKLTQTAYIERRSTLSNAGTTADWDHTSGVYRYGKLFPRGARGFINTIDVYCRDAGTSGGTITVYISPNIGMGSVASAVITVAAGGSADYRSATFNRMWNYDSLFIWIYTSTIEIQYGYDVPAESDGYDSADSGVSWRAFTRRAWFRVVMKGETVGDVPVSGTINTIEIPSISAVRQNVGLNVGPMSQVFDNLQVGCGETLIIIFHASGANVGQYLCPLIRCDGVDVIPVIYSFVSWNDYLIGASTPGIALGKYDTTNLRYCIVVTVPYPFKRSLEIGYNNVHPTATLTGYVSYSYKKIS